MFYNLPYYPVTDNCKYNPYIAIFYLNLLLVIIDYNLSQTALIKFVNDK